jgi:muramoyltetrapeptide carboxypeptidase
MKGAPLLAPGARIAVVAPAGIPDSEGLAAGLGLLEEWGYAPVPGPHLRARRRYLAGSVEERSADLAWALAADDIDATWIARGGFGSQHCLPHLAWDAVAPRPVIGFSDAVALLHALSTRTPALPIHGPNLDRLALHVDEPSRAALRTLLAEGGPVNLPGRLLCGPDNPVEGPVLGGNLCVLASLAGTPWALRAPGALLLLEDVGEPHYKLDRLVTQLRNSGALRGLRGIALGEFSACEAPADASWTTEDLLAELLAPLGVPVLGGLPVGHGRVNLPWYYAGRGRLHAEGLRVAALRRVRGR